MLLRLLTKKLLLRTNHREVYKKQSGGRGKFADIVVQLDLANRKPGIRVFKIKLKVVIFQENIFHLLRKVLRAMNNGVLAGYPMDSMKVDFN